MKFTTQAATALLFHLLLSSISQQRMIQQHLRVQLALSTGISKAACDQCSDNVAVFYEKDNFQGIQLQVSPQDKAYVLKNFKLDNKITSFKIGKNVRVVLCLDDSCEGAKWDRQVEIVGPYMTSKLAGNNDAFSSIKAFRYDANLTPLVQVFSDVNFEVDEGGAFPCGIYNTVDLTNHFINKNSIGSMVIPANVVVTIYNNNYQTGESLVLEGPKEISFEGSQLKKWNDNIESMVIKRAADFLKAAGEVDKLRGEWVKRFSTSNGKISSQLTIGITQETSETKSKTFGASLEAAASSGVSFLGSGAEITVTASASASMASEITSSLGTSRTTQSTVECDQASGRQSSLWQWRLRGTKGDKVVLSFDSEDYICKYGPDYLTPPKCPLGSCSDTECRGSCVAQ